MKDRLKGKRRQLRNMPPPSPDNPDYRDWCAYGEERGRKLWIKLRNITETAEAGYIRLLRKNLIARGYSGAELEKMLSTLRHKEISFRFSFKE